MCVPNIISPSLWQDEQGNYSQEYNELVDALREGHVVIWIGAGYSADWASHVGLN